MGIEDGMNQFSSSDGGALWSGVRCKGSFGIMELVFAQVECV